MDGATQCLPRVRLPVAQPPVPWGLPRFHPPTPRANPYPEVTDLFCRLPLSTLFYQLEAVHLGDLLRLSVRLGVKTIPSCGFSRGVTSASEGTKLPPLPERYPISRQTNSRVLTPLKRKDNSFQDLCHRPHIQLRCRGESTSKCRNFNRLPFWRRPLSGRTRQLCHPLGSTYPCPTAVHTEPFPTSVFKVLI